MSGFCCSCVNSLSVDFDADIYITGSNANLLSGELATYLAGRYVALLQNEWAWARYDKYPVSPGHLLITTRRHVQSYFDSTPKERLALNQLLEEAKKLLDKE